MEAKNFFIIATHKKTGKRYRFSLDDIALSGPFGDPYVAFSTDDMEFTDIRKYHEIPDGEVDDYDYEAE